MSDTFRDLPWIVATPAQKCVLFLREHAATLIVAGVTVLMLSYQLWRAFAAGRLPL